MLNGYHGAVFPHRFTGFTRHVAAQIGRLKIFPFWSYRCSGGSVTSLHTDRLGRFFKPEFFGYAGENLCDTSVRFRDDPDFDPRNASGSELRLPPLAPAAVACAARKHCTEQPHSTRNWRSRRVFFISATIDTSPTANRTRSRRCAN